MNDEEETAPIQRRRWRRIALAVAILLLVLFAAIWLARKPIAANFIDRELARRGVPARYEVKKIGFHTQRLEGVSIGDPRNPDLTAEWIEVDLTPTFGAPALREVRASGVRLRGRLVNGRLTLGAIDKLLPAPSGAPFRLPDLRVGLNDARLTLALPMGPVEVRLDGKGNLADGFSGLYAASAPVLTSGACRIASLKTNGGVAVRKGHPHLTGPVTADAVSCGANGIAALQGAVDVFLQPGLDGWRGQTRLAGRDLRAAGWSAGATAAQIAFEGNAAQT